VAPRSPRRLPSNGPASAEHKLSDNALPHPGYSAMACRQPRTIPLESRPRRPSWAQSPTSCLIETRISQLQHLLGTLDLVVIMTDEDKTEMETSRPSPLDPATEQAQPRQLTRDDQEWFSSFQQPAECLLYDCVEAISKHSRSPRRCPQLLLRYRRAAQQRCTSKPQSVAVQPHCDAARTATPHSRRASATAVQCQRLCQLYSVSPTAAAAVVHR
jgi:hypothetical protein